jgi:hypothetical protein
MLGSLEVFNALLVTVEQKPEGYSPVLDIVVSLVSPALEVEIQGVLFSAKARRIGMRKSRDHAHDNLAIVGLTDFLRQLLFASSFPAFFAEPLIASPIRSMAELAVLGAPFELSHDDSRMVGYSEVIPRPRG